MAQETSIQHRVLHPSHDVTRLEGEFDRVFRSETLAGLKRSTIGRLVSLSVIAILLFYLMPIPVVFYYHIRS